MIRSYVTAALRNLTRNGLYNLIIISGLAVAMSAALLIAMFVHGELSYDELPLYERTYLLRTVLSRSGLESEIWDHSPSNFAAAMKLDFPQIEKIARLVPQNSQVGIRKGQIESNEQIAWADPDIFDVLRVPTIAGDPRTALQNPNTVVITRKIALKYFGRENPVGDTLEFDRQQVLTVTGVLADRPPNSQLQFDIVISGRSAFSNIAKMDSAPPEGFYLNTLTYFRLAPGASGPGVERAMPDFIIRHHFIPDVLPDFHPTMLVTPLNAVHLAPGLDPYSKPHVRLETIWTLVLVGVLIVLVAGINFVNLITAVAFRRATEVGIRKVAGASRADLMLQFLGETLLCIVLAAVVALALTELSLPWLNAIVDRRIDADWWRSGRYLGWFLAFIFGIAVLAGAYPAFVLSAFRPSIVLKSRSISAAGSVNVRRVLVLLQFAVLIGLAVATEVIYQQTRFALDEGLRLNKDQVYLIRTNCRGPFKDEVAALAGVRATACSRGNALGFGDNGGPVQLPDGRSVTVHLHEVDFGFFELYGLRAIAGRLFSMDHTGDALSPAQNRPMDVPVVINETAAREFSFANPARAVGSTIRVEGFRKQTLPSEIIGVVPDFQLASIRTAVPATVFVVDQSLSELLSVKLYGQQIPETLKRIDALWAKTDPSGPIDRIFVDQHVEDLYRDINQEDFLFRVFTGVALFIACTGLFALSASTAAQRTKEIGIRKALGAGSGTIFRLLGWEFAKPVIAANLIAWPVAYIAMDEWLHEFAYHVDISAWMFAAAGAVALLIALTTVSAQSLLAARAKPVTALRYE